MGSWKWKFSVLVGSIFEDSTVPLTKWLAAFYMLTANKNGVAAFEIRRTLGVARQDGVVHDAPHP